MNTTHPARRVRLRVQELAKERGWPDRELAIRAGVNVNVVRRMWANQQVEHITLSQLVRVAEALDVPTCELIEDMQPSQ